MILTVCAFSYSACGQNVDSTSALTSLLKDAVKDEPFDDSLMQKALGDSIYDIIINAKSVAVRLTLNTDSVVVDTVPKKLGNEQVTIVKYLVSDPKNYAGNSIVYGQFLPNISFTFSMKKKDCTLKFDFGLKKLGVYDSNGNELKLFDLHSMEIVRFAYTLYPDNKFFVKLLNYK